MVTITARQRVLEFIRRRNAASAAQIGRGLSMSAATVRHHLSILAGDGRIVAEGVSAKGKRGRPEKIYRLSDRVAGENFSMLSDIVLSSWLNGLPEAKREAAVASLADQLRARMGATDLNLPAPKRIVQLTERLDALHYQARWEAGAEGPRILFGHCPYAAIVSGHPELCAMDAAILSGEMNADVEQLSKIDRRAGGASQCVFAVRGRRVMARG